MHREVSGVRLKLARAGGGRLKIIKRTIIFLCFVHAATHTRIHKYVKHKYVNVFVPTSQSLSWIRIIRHSFFPQNVCILKADKLWWCFDNEFTWLHNRYKDWSRIGLKCGLGWNLNLRELGQCEQLGPWLPPPTNPSTEPQCHWIYHFRYQFVLWHHLSKWQFIWCRNS